MSGADLAMMDAPIKVIFPFKYLRRETCSAGLSYNNDKDFTVWISDILYFDHSEDCSLLSAKNWQLGTRNLRTDLSHFPPLSNFKVS